MKKHKPREKLSKRSDTCLTYADKIHKINPTLTQIEGVLYRVWEIAYQEGYEDAILDHKKLKDSREAFIKSHLNNLRDYIDDTIDKNKK